jgi:hypothetical protein
MPTDFSGPAGRITKPTELDTLLRMCVGLPANFVDFANCLRGKIGERHCQQDVGAAVLSETICEWTVASVVS